MSSKTPFYITTTLPYVNANPHIGFAMEVIRADAIARYQRLQGRDVYFNTGTDEHGIKIYQKAAEAGKDTQEFVDGYAQAFKNLKQSLNLSYDTEGIEGRFIRTTDEDHKLAAQAFWKQCQDNGYIYKKNYKGLYCVGCEMFLTEKDVVNGECPLHPGKQLEEIEEENYFFKFSAFGDDLLQYYKENPDFITPVSRLKEMQSLIEQGLEDFSISRLKEKLPWGVAVPGDEDQVMYVWFDALVDYISTLGWPDDANGQFKKYWQEGEVVQICGKDNTQHQAVRWQAMLRSVGLPYSNKILVNGFITSGGQKMSKSLGNVVDPLEIVQEYGTDALRYYVLRELHPYEDSDFTPERMLEAYNANLANGIGNLVNRILKMAEDNLDAFPDLPETYELPAEYVAAFDAYNLQQAADYIWKQISGLDERIQETQPFKLVKEQPEEAKKIISELIAKLHEIGYLLQPLLPDTAENIAQAISAQQKPQEPLFARK